MTFLNLWIMMMMMMTFLSLLLPPIAIVVAFSPSPPITPPLQQHGPSTSTLLLLRPTSSKTKTTTSHHNLRRLVQQRQHVMPRASIVVMSSSLSSPPQSQPPPQSLDLTTSSSLPTSGVAADDVSINDVVAKQVITITTTITTPRMTKLKRYASYFCNLFPVWTLMTAITAINYPHIFLRIPSSTFPAQIGLLMLCMGITLKPSDFQRVIQRPAAVLLAFIGCYGIMPSLAWTIGKVMGLSPSLAAGLILVACINGAQASNLCTYIGQGDLALSVLMTTMTTIGAIVMTPLMGKLLLGTVVPVNALAIAKSTVQVVLAPILVGMTFNAKYPKVVQQILPFSPILGVILTCLLVGTSVAGCAPAILSAGLQLQVAAALLHGLGGVAGYFVTKPFYAEDVCRTFAIEFAMKSSAFGYLLATLHFPDFAVRVPAAVSIVWMTLIGSSLAVASRYFPPKECILPDE